MNQIWRETEAFTRGPLCARSFSNPYHHSARQTRYLAQSQIHELRGFGHQVWFRVCMDSKAPRSLPTVPSCVHLLHAFTPSFLHLLHPQPRRHQPLQYGLGRHSLPGPICQMTISISEVVSKKRRVGTSLRRRQLRPPTDGITSQGAKR